MKPKRIFLSYAREDTERARQLYQDLKAECFRIWFDEESLVGGQKWKREISKTIRESDFFIALLSEHSVSKRGVVQKELKEAIDVMQELPEGAIYLIPARLSDCRPSHEVLEDIQWIDLFSNWDSGVQKIRMAMFREFYGTVRSGDFSPISLADIIKQSVTLLNTVATKQQVGIALDIRTVAKIMGDESMISQALLNLLMNAIHHSFTANAKRPTIHVILYESGGTVYVTIENTGNLIDSEHIYSGKLFTPFFTTTENGTGLGLAITKIIVEEHNGIIFVASNPNELGMPNEYQRSYGITNFTIALPKCPEAPQII